MAYVTGKSGYVDIAGDRGFTARIYWSETYDFDLNKSIVSIDKITIQSLTYGGSFFPDGPLSIDGTVIQAMENTAPATHSVYVNAGTSWWTISHIGTGKAFPWVSGEIVHDADGSKSVTIALDLKMWREGLTVNIYITGSATIELTDIPRASTATVPDFTIGTKGTISIARASSAFTHKLFVTLGGTKYQIASGVTTSYAWTPAAATWGPRIPNATSATCTMTVDTYNGSTLLGSTEYSFKLSVPSTIVPKITAFTTELVNDNSVLNGWGIAVKGFTKLKWSITAEGAHGSTISSYAFTAGTLKGSNATGTTAVLPAAADSLTPTATVKDSRGRSAKAEADAVVVYDYTEPTISKAEAFRCDASGNADPSGTSVRMNFAGSIASVNGQNTATYQYRYKTIAGSYSSWTEFASGDIISGFSTSMTYVIDMRVVDALGKSKSTSITITTREEWLHGKDGGKGAAFGKVAEEDNLLDVAWDLRVRGNTTLDNPLPLSSGGLGASTAIEALANLFALNLNHITDADFYVNSGDDLDSYTTPGAYRIPTAAISASLLNGPVYKSAGGRLIVTATSTGGAGLFQLIIYNTVNYQIWYRIRSDASVWGKWQTLGTPHSTYSDCRYVYTADGYEWFNPPMVVSTEYRTTERWNNKVVYTKLVNCGAMTNGGSFTYADETVYPVRYAGYINGNPLPSLFSTYDSSTWKYIVRVEYSKIYAYFGSSWSTPTLYVQVWYTK